MPQPDMAMVYGMDYAPSGQGGVMGSGGRIPGMMLPGDEDDSTDEVPVYGDLEVDLEDV